MGLLQEWTLRLDLQVVAQDGCCMDCSVQICFLLSLQGPLRGAQAATAAATPPAERQSAPGAGPGRSRLGPSGATPRMSAPASALKVSTGCLNRDVEPSAFSIHGLGMGMQRFAVK